MPLTRDYQESLIEALTDPLEAAEYLNAALEDGDRELFLLCLKNVVNPCLTFWADFTAILPKK